MWLETLDPSCERFDNNQSQVENKDQAPVEEAEVGDTCSEDWELKYRCLLALVKMRGFVTGDPFSEDD